MGVGPHLHVQPLDQHGNPIGPWVPIYGLNVTTCDGDHDPDDGPVFLDMTVEGRGADYPIATLRVKIADAGDLADVMPGSYRCHVPGAAVIE